MKKTILLFLFLTLMKFPVSAATVVIQAEDFEFDPAFVTINTGDTIIWMWDEGVHTTTSTTIPAGAIAWNSPLTSTSPVFMYVPSVAGTYMYECQPHSSMGMQGVITVNSTVGLNENSSASFLNHPRINGDEIVADFRLVESSTVDISIYDLTGKKLITSNPEKMPAGEYQRKMTVAGLPPGIYIFSLNCNNSGLIHRFVIPK